MAQIHNMKKVAVYLGDKYKEEGVIVPFLMKCGIQVHYVIGSFSDFYVEKIKIPVIQDIWMMKHLENDLDGIILPSIDLGKEAEDRLLYCCSLPLVAVEELLQLQLTMKNI